MSSKRKKNKMKTRQKWECGEKSRSSKKGKNLFLLSGYIARYLNLEMKQQNHIHIKPLKINKNCFNITFLPFTS